MASIMTGPSIPLRIRRLCTLGLHLSHPTPLQVRNATTSSLPKGTASPPRRAVTVVSDTGRVPWQQLSIGEKAARTTQQSFNLLIVLLGIVATGGVATVLYLEVFSTDSKTAVFNRAADRVRKDPQCIEVLAGRGKGKSIEAYGEASWSRWARNRFIASRTETDRVGTTHMHMHFNVSGPLASGVVNLHMTRKEDEKEFRYQYLALDVPGQDRVWLENADKGKLDKRSQGKMFGVRWW